MKSNFKQGVRKITSLLLAGVLTLSAIPGSSLTTYASSMSEETTSTEVTVDSNSETIVVGDTEASDTTTVISNSSEDETIVTDDTTDISSLETEEASSELSEDTQDEVYKGYASIEVTSDSEDSETTDLSGIVYDVYSDDECTESVGSFALSYDGKAYVSLPDMEESGNETTELVDTVYYDSKSLETDLNASIKYLELESGTIYYAQMNESLYDSDDTVDSKDVIYNDSLISFTVTSENVTTDTAYVIKISVETSEKATSEEGNSTEDEESSDDDGDPEPESSSEETTEAGEDVNDSTYGEAASRGASRGETTTESTTEDIIYVEAVRESESLVSAEPVVIAAGTLGSLNGTTESSEESESSETELSTATMTDGEESTVITDGTLTDTEDTEATESTEATEDEETTDSSEVTDASSEEISDNTEITGTLTSDTATTTDAETDVVTTNAISDSTSLLSTITLFISPNSNGDTVIFDHLYSDVDVSGIKTTDLFVQTSDASVFTKNTNVVSNYEDIYIISCDSVYEAKYVYSYYYDKVQYIVDLSDTMTLSDNDEDSSTSEITDELNIEDIADFSEINETKDDAIAVIEDVKEEIEDENNNYNGYIALIDSGVNTNGINDSNLVTVSVVDDNGDTDAVGHGTKMYNYIKEENLDAKVLSIKAFNGSTTDVASVYAAIRLAIDSKVSVINLSLVGVDNEDNKPIKDIITEAINSGITVIGAAGNASSDATTYVPGSVDEVITIGAVNEDQTLYRNSNYNADYYVVATSTSEAAARYSGLYTAGLLDTSDKVFDDYLTETDTTFDEGDSNEFSDYDILDGALTTDKTVVIKYLYVDKDIATHTDSIDEFYEYDNLSSDTTAVIYQDEVYATLYKKDDVYMCKVNKATELGLGDITACDFANANLYGEEVTEHVWFDYSSRVAYFKEDAFDNADFADGQLQVLVPVDADAKITVKLNVRNLNDELLFTSYIDYSLIDFISFDLGDITESVKYLVYDGETTDYDFYVEDTAISTGLWSMDCQCIDVYLDTTNSLNLANYSSYTSYSTLANGSHVEKVKITSTQFENWGSVKSSTSSTSATFEDISIAFGTTANKLGNAVATSSDKIVGTLSMALQFTSTSASYYKDYGLNCTLRLYCTHIKDSVSAAKSKTDVKATVVWASSTQKLIRLTSVGGVCGTGTSGWAQQGITYVLVYINNPTSGVLRIRKRADDNSTKGAEGAVFTIYVQDTKNGKSKDSSRKVATAEIGGDDFIIYGTKKYAVSEWKTFTCSYFSSEEQALVKTTTTSTADKLADNETTETYLQLPAGYYYIVETEVPSGYDAADPAIVEVTADDDVTDPAHYFALNTGTKSAVGKFSIYKESDVEATESNNNYNMAGITYGVYSTYDSDSKTVSDRIDSDGSSTLKTVDHITLSWDGSAYCDEDGYNIVFVSSAAKKAYKAAGGTLSKMKWRKEFDGTSSTTYSCYVKELSTTWYGDKDNSVLYKGTSYSSSWNTSASYNTYWYDNGSFTSEIKAMAGEKVPIATGYEVSSTIYRMYFVYTVPTEGDAYTVVTPYKGATGTNQSGLYTGEDGTTYAVLYGTDPEIYGKLSLEKSVDTPNSNYSAVGAIYQVYYAETWTGFDEDSSGWVNVGYFETIKNSSGDIIGRPYLASSAITTNYGITAHVNSTTWAAEDNYFNNMPVGYYVIQEESSSNSGYQVNNYRYLCVVSKGTQTITVDGTTTTLSEGTYLYRSTMDITSMANGIAKNQIDSASGNEGQVTIEAKYNPDPEVYGKLSLYKTSSIDPNYLDSDYYDMEGATYTVTSGGTTVASFTTYTNSSTKVTIGVPTVNSNGTSIGMSAVSSTSNLTVGANYLVLPLGTYTITESKAPKGYKTNSTTWTVTVSQDENTGIVTTTLKKGSTTVQTSLGDGVDDDIKQFDDIDSTSVIDGYPEVTIGLAYTTRTDGTSTNNNVDPPILGGLQLIKTANKGEQTSIDVSYLKGLKFYVYKTTGDGGSYSSSDLVATYTHTGNSTTPWSISLSSTYVSRYSSKYDNATGKITDIPFGWYVVVEDTDIANDKGTSGTNIEYVEVTRDWEEKIEEVSFDNPFTALTLTKTYDLALVDGMSNYSKKGAIYKVYVVSGDGVEPDSSSNYVCTFTTNEDGVGIVTDVGTFTADGNTYNYKIATTNVTNDTIKCIEYGAWVAIVEVPTTKTSGSAGCYIADTEWRHVTSDTKTVEFTSKETVHRDNLKISLQKVDLETGKAVPQGDATLEGAEFTIKYYDVDPEKYTTADNVSSLTPTKTWVYVTDENGKIEFSDETYLKSEDSDTLYYDNDGSIIVPLGVITIEETKAPTGYLLDNKYIEQTDGSIISDENGIVCIPIKMYQYLGNYVESDYCYYGTFVASNTTLEVTAYDPVKRGGFHIEKRDEETKDNIALGGANLKAHFHKGLPITGFFRTNALYIPQFF